MRRIRQRGWPLGAVLLALALLLAPLVNTAPHGPADPVRAVLALAGDHAPHAPHTYGQDHAGDSAVHDALDHDHSPAALLPPGAGNHGSAPPDGVTGIVRYAAGLPQDGPRRPPRPAV